IDFDDFDERLDRFVGLLVQQKVETPKIRQRQRARFTEQVPNVDSGCDPAKRENDGDDRQQPPQLEFHAAASAPSGGSEAASRRAWGLSSVALESGTGCRCGAGDRAVRRGRLGRFALFAPQASELPLEPGDLDDACKQSSSDAAGEYDQYEENERRLKRDQIEYPERCDVGVLYRQPQQRQEDGDADDPADDLHQWT